MGCLNLYLELQREHNRCRVANGSWLAPETMSSSSAPDLSGLINMPFAEWFTGACADDTEDTPITLWDGLRTTTRVP